jgi:hypothetical protein
VVKSLELIGSGPVGLVHRQKVRFFQKKNPTAFSAFGPKADLAGQPKKLGVS